MWTVCPFRRSEKTWSGGRPVARGSTGPGASYLGHSAATEGNGPCCFEWPVETVGVRFAWGGRWHDLQVQRAKKQVCRRGPAEGGAERATAATARRRVHGPLRAAQERRRIQWDDTGSRSPPSTVSCRRVVPSGWIRRRPPCEGSLYMDDTGELGRGSCPRPQVGRYLWTTTILGIFAREAQGGHERFHIECR